MKYTKIDEEQAAKDQLRASAIAAENAAFQAEMTYKEQEELGKEYNDFRDAAVASEANAAAKRAEADAFAAQADLDPEEVKTARRQFLENWIASIEMNHIGHATNLRVLEEAGLPSAGHDTVMAQLEISHRIALDELANLK